MQYLVPVIPAGAVAIFHVRLQAAAELLSGLAIFTGLLFGLLILVYTAGVQLRADAKWRKDSTPAILLADLRANLTYACGVSLMLTATLALAAALTADPGGDGPKPGLAVPWSIAIAYFAGHLVMTMGVIMKRLKSGYDQLTT